MKILYLTGARSDYGLMRRTLLAINKRYSLSIVVTGMHLQREYGYTVNEIKKDGLHIWKKIPLPYAQSSVSSMMKNMRYLKKELQKIMRKDMFDICLVEGDRYEALAMAQVAKMCSLPVWHQGGGDKSGGLDDRIRWQITDLASVHLTGNVDSASRLQAHGVPKENIYMFGEPGLDAIAAKEYTSPHTLRTRYGFAKKEKILLCSLHPDTLSKISPKKQILPLIAAIERLRLPTVVIYPNNDAGSSDMIREIKKLRSKPYVRVVESLSPSDFLGMLALCNVFVGNSSAGLTEASFLNVPFVNIGHRQKGRLQDKNVTTVSTHTSRIVGIIQKNLDKKGTFKVRHVYGKGNFTRQCLQLLNKYERNR